MDHPDIIPNKYYHTYMLIISRAQQRPVPVTYTEKHHILPKALGGSNSKDNLVHLTPKEHYVCHHLLFKFTKGQSKKSMLYAWNMMANMLTEDGRKPDGLPFATAAMYQRIKKEFARLISKHNKGRLVGSNSPRYDDTVYKFYNWKRNEMFEGTQWELQQYDSCISSPEVCRIVKSPDKSSKGWMVWAGVDKPVPYCPKANNKSADRVTHKFFHPDHGEIQCTRRKMFERFPQYGFTDQGMCDMFKGRTRSHKGWSLIQ